MGEFVSLRVDALKLDNLAGLTLHGKGNYINGKR
jgi:hypothetical protein